MPELLWLLLPVAALSGWMVGRNAPRDRAGREGGLSSEYFRGLNYLLDEKPDKAIEVFTRMVEVDSDTVDTHFALGNLFRRRGEVDRAIRIHQNLIARPTLAQDQRDSALLELGKDYMRAGLLDRAEDLFQEVAARRDNEEAALQHLLDIYQQEKEWEDAVSVASRLEAISGRDTRALRAQFVCEQAEEALRDRGDGAAVRRLIRRAYGYDAGCVRAGMLRGELERRSGNWREALKAFREVGEQDVAYLPEVLGSMEACYRELGELDAMVDYLQEVKQRYAGVSVVNALANLLLERRGRREAIEFMAEQLRQRPSVRGLRRLIELNLDEADSDRRRQRDLAVLHELFDALLAERPAYRCGACGFEAKRLHWHCPSCRDWGTIKPIKGVQGE